MADLGLRRSLPFLRLVTSPAPAGKQAATVQMVALRPERATGTTAREMPTAVLMVSPLATSGRAPVGVDGKAMTPSYGEMAGVTVVEGKIVLAGAEGPVGTLL